MWYFKSSIGLMKIIQTSNQNPWALYIGDECFGEYPSPVAAADDVYTHHTGCDEWDASNNEAPTDIYEWLKS